MKQNAQLFQMLVPVLKTAWDLQDPQDQLVVQVLKVPEVKGV